MDLEQFKKAENIQNNIKYMKDLIEDWSGNKPRCLRDTIYLSLFNDKDIVKSIISTLKEQVDRLQTEFDNIK